MRIVVTVALVVALAACAEDSSSAGRAPSATVSESTTNTTTSTTPTSTPEFVDPCADLALGGPVAISPVDGLVEISGAVFATDHGDGPSLWVHQDSGNPPTITRVGLDGAVRQTVTLAEIDPFDWEDVAWAMDTTAIKHLFVGDIGDNRAARTQVKILRFTEPSPETDLVDEVDEIVLTLPHGPADAEALIVDPSTGDLLVLTKSVDGVADVLVAPGGAWVDPAATITLQSAGTIDLGFGNAVLAADIDPGGHVIGIRTPLRVLLWTVDPGQAISEVLLDNEPCRAPAPFDIFGEALALSSDGYTLTGESERPTLVVAGRSHH